MPKRSKSVPPIGPYATAGCLRCGYTWEPRWPNQRPGACPQCGSRGWDTVSSRANARNPDSPPAPSWTQKYGDVCGECGRRNPSEKVERGIVAVRKVRADRAHGRKKSPAPPSVPAGAITLSEIGKSMRALQDQEAGEIEAAHSRMTMMPTPPPGNAQRMMQQPTPPPVRIVPSPPAPMPSRHYAPNPEEMAARRDAGASGTSTSTENTDTLSAELESELSK